MLNAHKFKQTSAERAKKEAAANDCCVAKGHKSLFVLCLCGGEKCGGSNFRLDWQQDVGATASTLTGIILQNTTQTN